MPGLDAFHDPACLAVVGASDDPTKWGSWLAEGALRGAPRRRVYLVNHRVSTVAGVPAWPSLSALPETPDLVALCVPGGAVPGLVAESLRCGSRALLTISTGVPDQPGLARLLEQHGARMIGPNSLGLYDAATDLQLTWGYFSPGRLAIVSQSGQIGSEIADLAARAGLGVSRFVSVGTGIDVTATDLLADLHTHAQTDVVAIYLEGFADGRVLVDTLRSLTRSGKPVLVLATGASEGSRRLAHSHTGALTSAGDVIDAACRAAGAIRVGTPFELVAAAQLLLRGAWPAGRRIAVVSDSGGQGAVAADTAAARGLDTPALSPHVQHEIAQLLPPGAETANPVDLAGAGEADLTTYPLVCERLTGSGEVDAVVFSGYLGRYGEDTPSRAPDELEIIDRLGAVAQGSGPPVIVHSMSVSSPAVARLAEHGIPTFAAIEQAMAAIVSAVAGREFPGRDLPCPRATTAPASGGYWASRQLLVELGIDVPAAVLVTGASLAAELDACACLTFPVVLKAGWLAHKSEHGGVRLGIDSLEQLREAYDAMLALVGEGDYVVEEQDQRPHTVEMIVGARRDRDFGPVVMVGAGGTETELHRDTCLELAAVDHRTARSMIERLRTLPLLQGWRGRPGVDLDALAAVIVSVSEAVAGRADITELDLNPVRVGPGGALTVDALLVAQPPAPDVAALPTAAIIEFDRTLTSTPTT